MPRMLAQGNMFKGKTPAEINADILGLVNPVGAIGSVVAPAIAKKGIPAMLAKLGLRSKTGQLGADIPLTPLPQKGIDRLLMSTNKQTLGHQVKNFPELMGQLSQRYNDDFIRHIGELPLEMGMRPNMNPLVAPSRGVGDSVRGFGVDPRSVTQGIDDSVSEVARQYHQNLKGTGIGDVPRIDYNTLVTESAKPKVTEATGVKAKLMNMLGL